MKLTVIGHWGAYPEVGEATSGYLLEEDGYKLLIDCGSGVLSQLQHFCSLSELDAVILSHYHHDHIADVGPLQYSRLIATQLKNTGQPLLIYGHSFDQDQYKKLAKEPYVFSKAYDEQTILQLGPFTIRFLETEHKGKCFAMRIEARSNSIVYSADSSYMPQFTPFANKANIIICESSFYANEEGKPYGHMNCLEAATIARDANVQTLILSHLPHFGDHQELVRSAKKVFSGNVLLAKKGLQITL